MRKIVFANIIFIIWTLCSCVNSDTIDVKDSIATLREGVQTLIKSGQDTLSVKLISVTPIYTEGLNTEDGNFTIYKTYDAKIDIRGEELIFRTLIITNNHVRQEKSWDQLEKTYQGIKTYKSYQLGISDIYLEESTDSNEIYIVKILIK